VKAIQREMKTKYSDELILIRPYRPSDVDNLYEAARESINQVYRWLPWCHPLYSIEESIDWIRSRSSAWEHGKEYSFVIEDAVTGKFLGGTGINEINSIHKSGNLGYWVRSTETGRGVASAATLLTAVLAFEQLHLHRVEIIAAVKNLASQRVAEKAGAMREGILRRRLLINGNHHDAIIYSLLPEDLT